MAKDQDEDMMMDDEVFFREFSKRTPYTRFGCNGTCGWTWRLDNLYVCKSCYRMYCYQCVHTLQCSEEEKGWKCHCGSKVE